MEMARAPRWDWRRTAIPRKSATGSIDFIQFSQAELVLMKSGRVVAQGPTRDVLTAANIRQLYGVDADVTFHPRAGHLTVVPLARTD